MAHCCIMYLILLWLHVCHIDAGSNAALVGSLCSPPVGYLPLACRTLNIISTSSETLPVNIHGVNVCEVTRLFLVQVYEYRYRQQCGWDYHNQYRYYYWTCRVECVSSGVCLESMTRVESSVQSECCEGFAPRPVEYNQFNPFHSYYIPDTTQQPTGCPLAVGSTLLECLETHGLSTFIDLISQAGLTHLVNSTDNMITVFAPSNSALEGMIPDDIERFVRSHIVMKPVDANMLYHSTQLESAADDVTLYVTLIEHYYYRPLLWRQPATQSKGGYNPYTYQNYQHNRNNFILLRTDRYINGNLVAEPDACITDTNHDLHLIDSFIPITNQSVVDVIASTPSLSMFNMALDLLNINTFLRATTTPHTVFAPSNNAFIDFPMTLIECLNNFDREPLNNLILYHIAEQVHYLSSLSQEKWLYTRLLRHMAIDVDNSGRVVLGDDRVTITRPNIPASDGVVHIIDDIIFPDMFDYGDCMSFIGSGMQIME